MDAQTTHHLSTTRPAQLWIGPHDSLEQKVILYLQKKYCSSQGCGFCHLCILIAKKQYHNVLWLCPEKNYALSDIAPIMSTISFALDAGQDYFFILQKTDFLTTVCANSLLKSIEEPPAGYHFILTAQRTDTILPTIKSRCTINTFYSKNPANTSSLYDYYTSTAYASPTAFMTALEQSKINEQESIELLDILLTFWIENLKQATFIKNIKKQEEAEQVIHHLKQAISYPPMPGSSKLLWKNLFLQIKQ